MAGGDRASFLSFEFRYDYEVEISPEFPGTGEWAETVHVFNDPRVAIQSSPSAEAAPLVVRVESADGGAWIGKFASGYSGISGIYACPASDLICVIAGGCPYLVKSTQPEVGAVSPSDQVIQVLPSPDASLLFLVNYTDIVAIGKWGPLWNSGRLVLDNLRVVEIFDDEIHCLGTSSDLQERKIIVDAANGSIKQGSVPGFS
ncbi:hypothetical protein [Frankia sp. R43]|uniref:hypothetical protein n=1 Tax=Frankia sp. R43 TaxID=269536 RepID=UPI00128F24C8|nr:hypothetical protein [Frankia sp. R43]